MQLFSWLWIVGCVVFTIALMRGKFDKKLFAFFDRFEHTRFLDWTIWLADSWATRRWDHYAVFDAGNLDAGVLFVVKLPGTPCPGDHIVHETKIYEVRRASYGWDGPISSVFCGLLEDTLDKRLHSIIRQLK